MEENVDALERAAELPRRAQIGPKDLYRGRPAERLNICGRSDQSADLDAPGKQCADYVLS
jgi:hypothetical protein